MRFETFQRYKRSTIKPSLANEGESGSEFTEL